MTIIEKILAGHSRVDTAKPGDILDVEIDARVARDFGGANVVKNIRDNKLGINDAAIEAIWLGATSMYSTSSGVKTGKSPCSRALILSERKAPFSSRGALA